MRNGIEYYQPADFGLLAEMAKRKKDEIYSILSSIVPASSRSVVGVFI